MTTDITKILIANRGEIACRVIRTARRMGIATVAVYSDADRAALHVRMADEAVPIGPAPAVDSYLVIDKIIAAAKDTGADAIHPGYGFLSENPDFVRACAKAKITFIGPSAEAIEAMGLKDAAKALMIEAGVPVTPGYQGDNQDPDYLAKEAGKIGYPVLIKAVAGGGGKGMRKVERAGDFKEALASCQREAASSFGNDVVLIEKYITSPRHIEVQVFGDTHGHVVHMFERDCSLQRRHQKVIEEAPAPGMTDEVRAAMTNAAVKAAQAVNYVGAGTVEFIVDGSGALRTDGFYFMEMNTRLQVEHPVTEEITGLDLVELQIRVARGEALPKQSDITMSGHAIEARIYAEDPDSEFAPSIGRIRHINLDVEQSPDDRERIDNGVEAGDRISLFYDPMIAKLIGLSKSREDAIINLEDMLDRIEVTGIKTNAAFLTRCIGHPEFENGDIDTGFIARNIASLKMPRYLEDDRIYAQAAYTLVQHNPTSPFDATDGFRINLPARHRYLFEKDNQIVEVDVVGKTDNEARLQVDGRTVILNLNSGDKYQDNESALETHYQWDTFVAPQFVSLKRGADIVEVKRFIPKADDVSTSPNALTAPMPGKVISVAVSEGEAVTEGQTLLVLEAMKMEMAMKAPRDGVIGAVNVEAGSMVNDGDVLVALEETD